MKPGYKTGAFWMAAAATAVAALFGSGAVESGAAAQMAALAASALGGLGYASWRTFKKSEAGAKPAWRTTEFWLSCAAVAVGAMAASGAFAVDSAPARVIGVVSAMLAGLGYSARDKLPPTAAE